jgi:ketosteroid isomerase-like protein
MARAILIALAVPMVLAGPARSQSAAAAPATLMRQVFAAESSFAATMANRDSTAFASFVASDAIFFGEKSVMRGKAAVVDGWRPLFAGPKPPFS